MLRPRLPATILTAALSAATFDMVPAAPVEKAKEKEQAYAVVGQSTESTAATGRKPLAKRIAAANQPIRVAGPAWQGPQPDERTVVVAPLADTDGRPVDVPANDAAPATPGPTIPVVPPTLVVEVPLPPTAIDPAIEALGRVAEPPLVATLPATPSVESAPAAEWTSAVIGAADPVTAATDPSVRSDTTRSDEAAAAAPTMASVPRVRERLKTEYEPSATPILDKFRSTLTRLPRPLGLLPAPHTASSQADHPQPSAPRQRDPHDAQPRGAARTQVPAAPVAAADGPAVDQPPAAAPAAAELVATVGPDTTTATRPDDGTTADSGTPAPDTDSTAAPASAADAALVAVMADDPSTPSDGAACDCVEATAPPAEEQATEVAESDAMPAPPAATPDHTRHAAQRSQAHRPMPAPQRDLLVDRLRNAFARMPRPLGLVPMPAGQTGAAAPAHRHSAGASGMAASAPRRAPAGAPGGMSADERAVPARDSTATDTLLTGGDGSNDDVAIAGGSADAAVADPAPAVATTVTPSLLASTGDTTAAEGTTAPDATAPTTDTPADGTAPARPEPAAATPSPTPRAPARHVHRQAPAPRTVRDHLEAAMAAMPRPLGLLPAPTPRGTATPATHHHAHAKRPAPATPRPALATAATTASGSAGHVSPASGALPSPGEPTATTAAGTAQVGPAASADPDAPALDSVRTVEQVITADATAAPAAPEVIDLQIEGLPDATPTGEAFELTITIHNGSSRPLSRVAATVFFAEQIEPVGAGAWPVRLAPGVIAFDPLDSVAPGETVSLPIRAVGVVAGDCAYRVSLECPELDGALVADGSLTVSTPGPKAR